MEYIDEKVPALNLSSVIRWRRKLAELFAEYKDQVLVNGLLQELSGCIVGLLDKKIKIIQEADMPDYSTYNAIHKTLAEHALGKALTSDVISSLTAVIAGNIDRLRAGSAVPVWTWQLKSEWTIGMARDAYNYITPRRKIYGTMLVIELLTGAAAGQTVRAFFTDSSLNRLAIRIGAKGKKTRRALHPKEFVRLYIGLKIKAGEKLEVARYKEKASLAKRNIAKTEARKNYRKICPKHLTWPCYVCRFGYVECKYGTHAENYQLLECRAGHGLGWISPLHPQRVCTACTFKSWLSKHGGSYGKESNTTQAGNVNIEPNSVVATGTDSP